MTRSGLFLKGCIGLTIVVNVPATAQRQQLADVSSTYQHVAPSVFLIETRDAAGEPQKFGTGFVVAGNRIVTNAHVVNSGAPFLKVGALSVPLSVDQIDVVNDLAILSTDVAIDSPGLPVHVGRPEVGTRIWAIGNPQGLEKSMSEGLISGIRTMEGRTLLQVSAAISHGSSGGPIVDADGEVVGVAVAMLASGQNLNFAVPADVLTKLLDNRGSADGGFEAAIMNVRQLIRNAPSVFDDYEAWQASRDKIAVALGRIHAIAHSGDDFLQLATLASESPVSDDSTRAYVTDALRRGTTQPDSARALYLRTRLYDLLYYPSEVSESADSIMTIANTLLRSQPKHFIALRARALSLHVLGRKVDALNAGRVEIGAATDSATRHTAWSDYHLIAGLDGTASKDDMVFARMVSTGVASSSDWYQHGKHLEARNAWSESGLAYAQAFSLSNNYQGYACDAGRMFWLADSTDYALTMLRTCLTANATAAYPDTSNIVIAHRLIAWSLNNRGVYSQAESHARQALTLGTGMDAARAAVQLARALNKEGRYSEAVAAAQTAIRLSDGSLSDAHFQLGSAYFEMKDWKGCESAFKNADRADPTSYTAPYNAGLCLAHQGFYHDGAQWLRTALQRNPPADERAGIQRMIREWENE